MRTILVLAGLIFISLVSFAQNKTLGVGVSSPNPNAALHVESPGSNQGFIMPRLTTAQRTGMASQLTAGDNGLMLYDTDEKILYIWDGVTWKSSQQVAQANTALLANKLVLPYKDSVTTAPNGTNLISLKYNNTATESVGLALFENYNPNNNFNALFVRSFGLGGAGYFRVLNPGSLSPSLRGITDSNQPGAHGVYGFTTGTGGSGGSFQITNAASTQPALSGITD